MSELSSSLLHEAMDILSSLFQEKHVNIYQSTAKNIMKQLSFSQTQHASASASSSSQMTKNLYPSSQPGTEAPNACNKRGYQMMNNTKRPHATSSCSPAQKQSKDIFSALQNINIEKMKTERGCEVSHTQQEKVKKARLDCLICSSPPTAPLINECGHIACEECWYVCRSTRSVPSHCSDSPPPCFLKITFYCDV